MESNKYNGIDILEGEVFVPCEVDGYEISNYGRVLSLKHATPKLLKHDRYKDRCSRVYLSPKGRYRVHKLVAEAFVPNPYGFRYVRHKDGDKTNNHFSNLEWFNYENLSLGDKFDYDGIEVFDDEVFKEAVGFKGYYVSNYGKVVSLRRGRPRLMKQFSVTDKNFLKASVMKNDMHTTTSMFVHRQVALLFVPNPKKYNNVRHIDGDTKNNHFTNLEWYRKTPPSGSCYAGKWNDALKNVDECIDLLDGEKFYAFDVEGLDQYCISNMGRVVSLDIDGCWNLKSRNMYNSGYLMVLLWNNVKKKYQSVSIAKYLLERFVGPGSKNQVLGFKDEDPYNCRLDNLYWRTKKKRPPKRDVSIRVTYGSRTSLFDSYASAAKYCGMSTTNFKRYLKIGEYKSYRFEEVSDGR